MHSPFRYPCGPPTTARPAPRQCPTLTLRALPVEREDKRSFLQKLAEFIHPGPDSSAELIETLADAEDNDVIGAESRVMLEGVIRMADMTAGDVMVAAPRMDLVNIDAPLRRRCCTWSSTRRTRAFRSTRANARTSSASCWPRTCSSCSARRS